MAATQTTPQLLTAAQLSGMTPQQQRDYLASLDAAQSASESANLARYVQSANADALASCFRRRVLCPPAGGGTTSTYAAGSTLTFNLPVVNDGYVTELIVTMNIGFTPATGTSATYGWTAAGAYAWFNQILVNLNGPQATIRPYFLKILDTIRRTQALANGAVAADFNHDTTIDGIVATPQPVMTGGTATASKFKFRIPLNALHRNSAIGLLPVQGGGTQGQVSFTCAASLGATTPDPMQVPIDYTGGSGNGITLGTATVQVEAVVIDGTHGGASNTKKLPVLNGIPTCQYLIDTTSATLASGNIQRTRIANLLQHYVIASVIIDGGQSTSFATPGNIAAIEFDRDVAGVSNFYQYGPNTNTTLYDYFEDIRHVLGQDLDDGVILWNYAQGFNQENPDNRLGTAVLNMMAGGWPAATTGVTVTTATATNFNPRVETYLLSLNPAGLQLS